MNITFVLPEGRKLGGATTWSINMARKLVALDLTVSLIEHEHIEPSSYALPSQIRLVSCAGNHPDMFTEKDVSTHLEAYQRTLPGTIIPNWSAGTYAVCAAMSHQAASDFRVIGIAHGEGEHYNQWLTYYEPIIHTFIAVSRDIAETLARRMPQRANAITCRPCAVDIPPSLSRSYSQPCQPLRLVYAGRITQIEKRVFDFVQLAEKLACEHVNFSLRIIGDGEYRPQLLEQVQALPPELQQKISVEAAIPHDEIARLWSSTDICVLVSEHEGTSISMLEAMAHGCVPVVTRVSGTREVIRHGENGYSVNVQDFSQMVRVIQHLERHREHLVRLGENAYHTIKTQYSYTNYLPWFLDMIEHSWELPPRRWPDRKPLFRELDQSGLEEKPLLNRRFTQCMNMLRKLKHHLQYERRLKDLDRISKTP